MVPSCATSDAAFLRNDARAFIPIEPGGRLWFFV
jgi:hypothetical protein